MLKKYFQNLFQNKAKLILLVIGTVTWSLTMVKSGLVYPYGMGFWGPNGHDGIWHIALSQSLANGSWEMPVFAGENIKNYHIGFDILLAVLHKITFIPITNLYFQILPPVFAFFIGYLAYEFVFFWKKSNLAAFWSTFFIYFGGSWGYILTLIREKQIGGESVFWAQQSVSTLVNPPFSLSLIIVLSGLIFLIKGIRTENKKYLGFATFLTGTLVQVKIYAGVLMLTGLLIAGIWEIIKKKSFNLFKVFTGSLILSVIFFTPTTREITSSLIYSPFWFLKSLMSSTDRLYWPRFSSAMFNYDLENNILKILLINSAAFIIFLAGNLGTRILAVFWFVKKGFRLTDYSFIDVLVTGVIFAGILFPTFFIQSGTAWNTIQFFYYSLFFSGILSGIVFAELLEYKKLTKNDQVVNSSINKKTDAFIVLLILLTLPTTLGTLLNVYLPGRPPAKISGEEMAALNYLKKQPAGKVITGPFDKKLSADAVGNPPRPLYLYESSGYVSAFSGKPSYLDDEVNLEITDYPWRERREQVERFFKDPSFDGKFEVLERHDITYVYVVKTLKETYKDIHLDPERIFENSEILIYKY